LGKSGFNKGAENQKSMGSSALLYLTAMEGSEVMLCVDGNIGFLESQHEWSMELRENSQRDFARKWLELNFSHCMLNSFCCWSEVVELYLIAHYNSSKKCIALCLVALPGASATV
jgi:hypothetical protein